MATTSPLPETVPIIPKKCHSCQAEGFKRIGLFIKPTLKAQVQQYCQQRGFTMSDLIIKLLREEVQ